MYAIHSGTVVRGHGMASGRSVGQPGNWFPDSTLRLQRPYLIERGVDLEALVPGLHWGTINIAIDKELSLGKPDVTISLLDWTAALSPEKRIAPETFSFIHCCLCHRGRYHSGLLYYPHPETKPSDVRHRYDVLEVLIHRVDGLDYGDPVSLVCRSDAFTSRS